MKPNKETVRHPLTNKEGFPYDDKPIYVVTPDQLRFTMSYKGLVVMSHESLCKDHEEIEQGVISVNNSFYLRRRSSHKNYQLEYDVVFDDEEIGELLINSKGAFKNMWVKLGFSNHVLYSDWYDYYNIITKGLRLQFNNIESLHIACDGHGLFSKFKYLYRNSDIDHQPRFARKGKAIVDSLHNNGEYIVGRRNSGKVVACYDKTAEPSYTNGKKPYVKELHLKNGLDPSREIGRIELRADNKFLRHFNLAPVDLISTETLMSIFQQGTQKCLSFDDLSSWEFDHNNNKNYRVLTVVDYSAFSGKQLKKAFTKTILPKGNNTPLNIKIAFKILLYNYLTVGSQENLNLLIAFVRNDLNTLGVSRSSDGTHPYATEVSKSEYERLLKRYLSSYKGSMDAAALSRRKRIADLLFAETLHQAGSETTTGVMTLDVRSIQSFFTPIVKNIKSGSHYSWL